MKRWAIILALTLLSSSAYALRPSEQIIIFGKQGSASGGVAGCSGTSLIFNTPCNSMYVPIIH